ncbi:hypothetical protein D3C84_1134230 [compost metagenome]
MRRLRSSFQFGDAENVGAVFSRGPNQFDAFAEVCDVLAVAQTDLHDVDHFPIAVLAGVETVTLEGAVGLLFDMQAHASAGLIQGAAWRIRLVV